MRPSEVKRLIVILLSSSRNPENPRNRIGLTCHQICDRIQALITPDLDAGATKGIAKQVYEQLEVLVSEFEISSKGKGRKIYRMSSPSLILEREAPLRARYIGDRAYFSEVIELLSAEGDRETRLIDSAKSVYESRAILEPRGISVQTEEMLFEFLPDPALPSEMDLSMAEQLCEADIDTKIEVYIPRRTDFFDKRWIKLDEAMPSEISQLRRVKDKLFHVGDPYIYFWVSANKLYRLQREQALLTMYRIDLDRNAPRLLKIEENIRIDIKIQLPSDYCVFVNRYTEEVVLDPQTRSSSDDRRHRCLQVRFKYMRLFTELLESKLGINKPMNVLSLP